MQDASHDCFKWLASGIEAVALLQDCVTEIAWDAKMPKSQKQDPLLGSKRALKNRAREKKSN